MGVFDLRPLRWFLVAVAVSAAILGLAYGAGIVLRILYPLPYTELIGDAAARYDLDPFLVAAVIRVESRFFEGAVSEPGARGLMQVLPDTGRWVAEQIGIGDFRPAMLFDPRTNITIGTWYLAYLRVEFGDNPTAALAAYNAGRGTVLEWLDGGVWDGTAEALERIPYPETRVFVERVLRDREIYNVLYAGSFNR